MAFEAGRRRGEHLEAGDVGDRVAKVFEFRLCGGYRVLETLLECRSDFLQGWCDGCGECVDEWDGLVEQAA